MQQNEFITNPHLDGNDIFWQGNAIGFLLIHGFTATTAEVRLMAEKLHADGFTVAAPLLPGHGTHPDDLNRVTRQMWQEKVKTTYEGLLRKTERVYVIGESMGALLTVELAVQHPEIVGLILFSPAMRINGLWKTRLLAPFKAYLKKRGKDDGLPWKGYSVYPLKGTVEMLKLQQDVRKRLPHVTQPTLIFTGERDHTIASDSAQIILEGIQSNNKRLIHLEDSPHCILLDHELDLAYQHIKNFFNLNLP